ncbi:hypothetical protein CMO90_04085 [Candidatus Woesearchaeota archaeon]|jgi:radical SAM superfamily enzyme YgiQ (UPF0313 family)|nr:hypothetical protein [Candidatus Woesearchaeota archaeon]|tara:strand:- start:778 stop:2358 length:1581 start_codon:yes stop_codon:yes gene_type:complete
MKILFLYPNHEGYFRCPVGLTLVMTVCANEGHEVKLFDTTFMNVGENVDNKIREAAGIVKPVPLDHFFNKQSKNEIESNWLKFIEEFSPDIIGTTILEDSYQYCDKLLGLAKEHFNVLTVAGGSMPTIVPQVIIKNPNIDYVIEGESEVAFKELLKSLETRSHLNQVPNLWHKDKGKVIKNPLAKYLDMDEIPDQRLDFWDAKHFQKPYEGKLYTTGFFETSRGCMHKCHYCINRAFQLFQSEAGLVRRNKSVDRIIKEVSAAHKEKNFGLIQFTDDNFLARQPKELDELFERWKNEIKVPYWMNTCIETVNEHNLPQLKESGCVGIGIGMETGSDWVRQHLLLKGKMNNDFYMEKFTLMAKYGIRSTSNSMIGIPGEYEEDFFETVKLNKAIYKLNKDLTSFDVSFMAPYMGTVIHNIAYEMGLIEVHDKPGFEGMCTANITIRREPVMVNPCMSKERIIELFYDFHDYVTGKKEIPEKFLKNDTSRRYADNDEIYTLYEKYKKGPVDPALIIPKTSIQRTLKSV